MRTEINVFEWQALHSRTYNAQDIIGNTVRRSFATRLLDHPGIPRLAL